MKLDEAHRHSPSQTAYRYTPEGDLLLWTRGNCPERHTAKGAVVLDYMQLLVEQPAKDWRPVGDHTVRLDLVERLREAGVPVVDAD